MVRGLLRDRVVPREHLLQARSVRNLCTSTRALTLLAALVLAGCGPDFSPTFASIGDISGYVGSEITVMLHATAAQSGHQVSFDYAAPQIRDLKSRAQHPSLTAYSDGSAVFRWTPLARDVGTWSFDFSASDGRAAGHAKTHITVEPAAGALGPVFREPTGTGTTLDLSVATCFRVSLVVDDPAATHVTLSLADPAPEGAAVMPTGDFTGKLEFCPTPAQVSAQDRFNVTFVADDGMAPPSSKRYMLVVLTQPKPDCPGAAPTIAHTPPGDQTTLANLNITATVSDDIGIKGTPLLYYAGTPPQNPPDLGQMTMIEMTRSSGDARAGSYTGSIPNPVASSGGTATLYYVIVAKDDDDPNGTCDHTTEAGPFSFRVTAGGGMVQPYCGSCSADAQCGPGNLCVRLGAASDSFCMADCASGQACPQAASCSAAPITSVGGQTRRQCTPDSGSCQVAPTMCVDDALEDNDHRLSIPNPTSHDIPAGDYANLMICPAGQTDNDEDWYRMDIQTQTEVVCRIGFDTTRGDLDLALVNGSGGVVRQSYGVGNSELIRQCITNPGIYYFHVFSFFPPTQNGYSMHVERNPGMCCVDDALEPNDDADHATRTAPVPGTPYAQSGLQVCSGNDDFFAVPLLVGDRVVVDLTFMQATSQQDLDIHFYDRDGVTDLTPCPPCDVSNGQGTSSNEHFERTVSTAGTYYVVVHGYAGSANSYSIRIAVQ